MRRNGRCHVLDLRPAYVQGAYGPPVGGMLTVRTQKVPGQTTIQGTFVDVI
ncbi:MAG: hypothetical protein HPY73_07585 [Methanomassiliicoccales archaeon]|nr:MAG: hypothetical protein HPY73_07585 [Methanomassiliicoccales archaeon]